MGTSVKTIAQFAQNYNAGTSSFLIVILLRNLFSCWITGEVFQAYDFGRNGNLQRYGTTKPLVYDLKKVTAPVINMINIAPSLSYAKDDFFALIDVHLLW